jgi:hypothetical protein
MSLPVATVMRMVGDADAQADIVRQASRALEQARALAPPVTGRADAPSPSRARALAAQMATDARLTLLTPAQQINGRTGDFTPRILMHFAQPKP